MKNNLIPAMILTLTLQGCASVQEKLPDISLPDLSLPAVPGIYRADIVQGNIVDQEMVNQLKPGMNRRQVRYIMGSPLIIDPFHQQRWDYFYSKKSSGEIEGQQRITLYFEQEQLIRIEGDMMPMTSPPEVSVEIGDLEVIH